MYIPGLTRCSSVLHLWVQYPTQFNVGVPALGIVVGACFLMYPHDTPLKCDEFGGVKEQVTASYDDGTIRSEDWCVIRHDGQATTVVLEEMIPHYPDFLIYDPLS